MTTNDFPEVVFHFVLGLLTLALITVAALGIKEEIKDSEGRIIAEIHAAQTAEAGSD